MCSVLCLPVVKEMGQLKGFWWQLLYHRRLFKCQKSVIYRWLVSHKKKPPPDQVSGLSWPRTEVAGKLEHIKESPEINVSENAIHVLCYHPGTNNSRGRQIFSYIMLFEDECCCIRQLQGRLTDVALRWRERNTAEESVKSISPQKDSQPTLSSARLYSTPFVFEWIVFLI